MVAVRWPINTRPTHLITTQLSFVEYIIEYNIIVSSTGVIFSSDKVF